MYFVYIVECNDTTYYAGITTDIKRRLYEHNNLDKGAKYTKFRRPVKLVFYEEAKDRSEASKKEYKIKKLSRLKKMSLINSTNNKILG